MKVSVGNNWVSGQHDFRKILFFFFFFFFFFTNTEYETYQSPDDWEHKVTVSSAFSSVISIIPTVLNNKVKTFLFLEMFVKKYPKITLPVLPLSFERL